MKTLIKLCHVATLTLIFLLLFSRFSYAETTTLQIESRQFSTTPIFSNVQQFSFEIVIDEELRTGIFFNPNILTINYSVTGELDAGTPSGFDAFALVRDIQGAEFYAQGSSLQFEINSGADLSDGVQADEFTNNIIIQLNAREEDTGRFHPPILQLMDDGTGSIQNSNNSPSPPGEIVPGSEYITQLNFDPGNTTLLIKTPKASGGGSMTPILSVYLFLLLVLRIKKATPKA